ncbi:MAG: hypothetical protein EHM57_06600, partial [Actinobacteria bacterium]
MLPFRSDLGSQIMRRAASLSPVRRIGALAAAAMLLASCGGDDPAQTLVVADGDGVVILAE